MKNTINKAEIKSLKNEIRSCYNDLLDTSPNEETVEGILEIVQTDSDFPNHNFDDVKIGTRNYINMILAEKADPINESIIELAREGLEEYLNADEEDAIAVACSADIMADAIEELLKK